MTARIVRNKVFLQEVSKSKAVLRKKLIKKASKDNIDALSEVAMNTLIGNVPLSNLRKEKLRRHKLNIRKLAKKISIKAKKKFLVQKGGFLPLLIPPALSIIGGLAANALSHLVGL